MPPKGRGAVPAQGKTAQVTRGLTHLQSLNVIRNMIRVSVSEICYLRNLFPSELFKERVYADMFIKCLAPTKEMKSQDAKDALLITQWLEDGVFNALKRNYLESLVFCVYSISESHEPNELLESYTYTIRRAADGSSELSTSFTGAMKCTPENVKAQTIQLIRSLVSITNNMDPLPSTRLIAMKLFFNDTCPSDWQLKHFQIASDRFRDHDKTRSLKMNVGQVVTPHHHVALELETNDECLESLSQAASRTVSSRSPDNTDDESEVTTMVDETCNSVVRSKLSPSPHRIEEEIELKAEKTSTESRDSVCPAAPRSSSSRATKPRLDSVSSASQTSVASTVYDFEPDLTAAPPSNGKRKAKASKPTMQDANKMDGDQNQGNRRRCVDAPILQVRKALKKRKLSLKQVG